MRKLLTAIILALSLNGCTLGGVYTGFFLGGEDLVRIAETKHSAFDSPLLGFPVFLCGTIIGPIAGGFWGLVADLQAISRLHGYTEEDYHRTQHPFRYESQ